MLWKEKEEENDLIQWNGERKQLKKDRNGEAKRKCMMGRE